MQVWKSNLHRFHSIATPVRWAIIATSGIPVLLIRRTLPRDASALNRSPLVSTKLLRLNKLPKWDLLFQERDIGFPVESFLSYLSCSTAPSVFPYFVCLSPLSFSHFRTLSLSLSCREYLLFSLRITDTHLKARCHEKSIPSSMTESVSFDSPAAHN